MLTVLHLDWKHCTGLIERVHSIIHGPLAGAFLVGAALRTIEDSPGSRVVSRVGDLQCNE